jgi:hypothetical protein
LHLLFTGYPAKGLQRYGAKVTFSSRGLLLGNSLGPPKIDQPLFLDRKHHADYLGGEEPRKPAISPRGRREPFKGGNRPFE